MDRLTRTSPCPRAGPPRADRDECGVFGIHGDDDAARLHLPRSLRAAASRSGGCGIVASNGREHSPTARWGLVADNFGAEILDRLKGRFAVGHVRYSTSGESMLRNAQPICANTDGGPVSIAHNGNLVNAGVIRRELEDAARSSARPPDSEVILHLLARSARPDGGSLHRRDLPGQGRLQHHPADRRRSDRGPRPAAFRPLSIGRKDGAYVLSSETCALDLIGATHERDVEPGEVVVIRRGRLRSIGRWRRRARAFLHLRAHFCATGLEPRRPQRLRLPQGARPRARPGARRGRGHGDARARLGECAALGYRRSRASPTRRR
ncbi:MAG: hypothetical protein R3E53_11985 [Myxococcota bacterium]